MGSERIINRALGSFSVCKEFLVRGQSARAIVRQRPENKMMRSSVALALVLLLSTFLFSLGCDGPVVRVGADSSTAHQSATTIAPSTTRATLDIDLPESIKPAEIVGESYYQDAIESIAGPRSREGYDLTVEIKLRREPTNPHDVNAVQCLIDGKLVGHVAREEAPRLQEVLRWCEENGYEFYVAGRIVGGWYRGPDDWGYYGVKMTSIKGPR